MSEPTISQRRILEYLECLEDKAGTCSCENPLDAIMVEDECTEAINAIRRLIENRPRVTREFVEKWADNLNPDKLIGLHKEQAISHLWWREQQLGTMLRELGHEMDEEKEAR